jgi:hypothetical protein
VRVQLKRVRLERGPDVRDVRLGWTLWRALRLDELMARLLPEGGPGSRAVGHDGRRPGLGPPVQAVQRVAHRGGWVPPHRARGPALPPPLVNDDRLYRRLDRLLPHKAELEQHLVTRLGELFALEYDLLLYDVTSVYFEGQAAGNPLAQRGYSRDHRPDCRQVCLALVVTREGMPLGYELFAGNRRHHCRGDRRDHGRPRWARPADLGHGSRDDKRGQSHLAAGNRPPLSRWHPEDRAARLGARSPTPPTGTSCGMGWRQSGVSGPTGRRPFVLVCSVERREKERAMHALLPADRGGASQARPAAGLGPSAPGPEPLGAADRAPARTQPVGGPPLFHRVRARSVGRPGPAPDLDGRPEWDDGWAFGARRNST